MTKATRLLGLDGRKMSKSYNNFISLSEEPESVRKKVSSMFTDPLRIKFSDPGHPQKCNVHNYYAVFSPGRKEEVDELCRNSKIGCTDCKKELAGILIKVLEPIQEKRNKLLKDRSQIFEILEEGKKKAKAVAGQTLSEVKKLINL